MPGQLGEFFLINRKSATFIVEAVNLPFQFAHRPATLNAPDLVEKTLGFKAKKTVEDGIIEIKEAFMKGALSGYKDKKYSNYLSLSEYHSSQKDKE